MSLWKFLAPSHHVLEVEGRTYVGGDEFESDSDLSLVPSVVSLGGAEEAEAEEELDFDTGSPFSDSPKFESEADRD